MLFWMDLMRFKRELADATLGRQASVDGAGGSESMAPTRDFVMRKRGSHIIDTYMCNGAEMQVTLPDHKYSKRTAQAKPEYTYSADMFDEFVAISFRQIKQDTWSRFKLTDAAEKLNHDRPHLGVDPERSVEQMSAREVQQKLREQLGALADRVGCARITVWLINRREEKLWNVCSTQLGNTVISISLQSGLAGFAARTGCPRPHSPARRQPLEPLAPTPSPSTPPRRRDLIANDAQNHELFNRKVDKATAFVTRSVLCVVLKADNEVRAVVQLINKTGEGGAEGGSAEGSAAEGAAAGTATLAGPGGSPDGADAKQAQKGGPGPPFSTADAALVRDEAGPEILETCAGMALHQLLTLKPEK